MDVNITKTILENLSSVNSVATAKINLVDIIRELAFKIDKGILIAIMLILTFWIINNFVIEKSKIGLIGLLGSKIEGQLETIFNYLKTFFENLMLVSSFYILAVFYLQNKGFSVFIYVWLTVLGLLILLAFIGDKLAKRKSIK